MGNLAFKFSKSIRFPYEKNTLVAESTSIFKTNSRYFKKINGKIAITKKRIFE